MNNMNKSSIILNRKTFLLMALLLAGGLATAQVTIDGNVYGGGNLGQVDGSTTVTVNDGTIGKKIPLKDRKVDKDVQFNRVDYGNVYGGGNGIPETGTTPDRNKGLVTGNTTVTIGNSNNTTGPVVRRAVYGGGNMASVGEYTVTNGVVTYTAGGQTNVTVCGHALIDDHGKLAISAFRNNFDLNLSFVHAKLQKTLLLCFFHAFSAFFNDYHISSDAPKIEARLKNFV